eukprot:1192783-Prorocentrum_minimum.AAC.3
MHTWGGFMHTWGGFMHTWGEFMHTWGEFMHTCGRGQPSKDVCIRMRSRSEYAPSPHPIGPHRPNMHPPLTRLVHIDRICTLPSHDWSTSTEYAPSPHPIDPPRPNMPPPLI